MTIRIRQRPSQDDVRKAIDEYISSISEDLWVLNKQIHDNPETAFKEHKAHDNITEFLESHHRLVTRHAYSLDTAFESLSSTDESGRLVNFNAEYDALPDIGHGCGHNLISTGSITAYMALSHVLRRFKVEGRAQLLGTPAEEGGGGKIKLLEAGAYKSVDVSLMSHPSAQWYYDTLPSPTQTPLNGISGQSTLASTSLSATYTGRPAHAAANPWDGLNALDAVVASYNNISLLRQQLRPTERIHGAIVSAPPISNAIPSHTAITYTLRSTSAAQLDHDLKPRVQNCIEAGALATGCTVTTTTPSPTYADVKINSPLSHAFTAEMSHRGVNLLPTTTEPLPASTDQGNITHALPGLHAIVAVDAPPDAFPHNRGFVAASGTRAAFERYVDVGKGLAVLGWRVLVDDAFWGGVKRDFEGGATARRP